MSEHREILRRIAERGLQLAQSRVREQLPGYLSLDERAHKEHLDLWQHMLDEIQRVPEKDNC